MVTSLELEEAVFCSPLMDLQYIYINTTHIRTCPGRASKFHEQTGKAQVPNVGRVGSGGSGRLLTAHPTWQKTFVCEGKLLKYIKPSM